MSIAFAARAWITGLAALLALAGRAAAETGDSLCDARQSTADTCVIAADQTLSDGSVLTFTAPNVRVRSNLTTAFTGRCASDPATPCASDADCASPARCLRTAQLTIDVAGRLTIDAGAKITARGKAVVGDTIGADGGTITLGAHDVALGGTIGVSADAQGSTGVPAGHAGRIAIDADGTVTLAPSAFLDASTSSGGCGGTIGLGNRAKTPATLSADGLLSVDGATLGGTIELVARDQLTLLGTLGASNTSSDRRLRPACAEGAGGGTIRLAAASVDFDGSARARGKEAAGGVVRLEGVRAVTLDFPRTGAAISVTGGDAFAFTPGGGVFLSASAGDVVVRRGAVEADGISTGLGSDAGVFSLTATGTTRCLAGDTQCASAAECAADDACVERGGQVVVEAPLSAAGGAGLGSGCVACEVRGTAAVTVSAAIDVSGGKQGGVGGKVALTGGGDLTLGPGSVIADAFDGGDILLTAGSRVGAARHVGGALRIVNGTQVRATALKDNRFGGSLQVEGCDVTLEPSTALVVDGGSRGHAGQLSVVAHERLAVQSLATLSALPDGSSALTYRVDESIAPDAVLVPAFTLLTDPTLAPCPACGNGRVEPLEDCDGRGTCPGPGEVCEPPGSPNECTCAATCGTVAGIQPGEDCDGADLGGATCVSLGFGGGTLACGADCAFDTSRCGPERCGDGLVGPSEACDPGGIGGAPPSFGGATCESLGFPAGGSLACAPDCSAIITVPHCASTVTQPCTTNAECPGETCAAGCAACGNGFVDPGEECDEGAGNRDAANHCRPDCTRPRCGDATRDFSHCAGDPDAACTTAADCPAGAACVAGEGCDLGTATCIGGSKGGAPCCAEADCPGGDCPGDGCTANRNDIAGCCRCDCTLCSDSDSDCDDGNVCTTDTCDPVTGCKHTAVANGASCSDGNVCNGVETCQAGVCAAGAALDCNDGNPCTMDTCDPVNGCQHTAVANGASCSDGNVCNGAETCQAGICTAGTALNCNDNNVCTTDSCDPLAGCTNLPVVNGTPCSDGNVCNGAETCQAGICAPGTALDCTDANPCTTDTCDPVTGCKHTAVANGASCSDGNVCNGVETCQAGVCAAGTALDCNDGNPCTMDTCDPVNGCQHTAAADGTPCSDGNVCNGAETCRAGVCTAGTPLDCDDGNPCIDDRCEPPIGCMHVPVPDGTSCADGDPCNGEETCRAGHCTPGPAPSCDDGDRCTLDSCAGGECHHEPLSYDAIAASLAPSLDLQACTGQRIPPAIGRLMRQARQLVERAAHERRPKRAGHLVRRALGKLAKAVRTVQHAGRHGLSPECAGALGALVDDARAETACLLRPAGVVTSFSRALTAPTGRG